MVQLNNIVRRTALVFKIGALCLGIIALIIAIDYILNEYSFLSSLSSSQSFSFGDIILIVGVLSVSLTGMVLIASFPRSIRTKFPQKLFRKPEPKPTYGFVSVLAIGLGATLGSPLFILIPLNVVQFEFVSLGALALATVLSVLMAKVYADMYTETAARNLDAMGGPSFTKLAAGSRSVRYFVARLSMWIANTALAAYSKIVFIVFDFELMPGILTNFGIHGIEQTAIVWSITGVFVAWTVLNALFEERFLRLIGYIQIVLTTIMVAILIWQTLLLGHIGSWNLSGIFVSGAGGNWPFALVIQTGYLYLLFFGFQEIQALERDVTERSSIPIVSWIKRGYTMAKSSYLGVAMVLSVLIAAAINILYAVAVFSLHPSYQVLLSSQIPALFLAHLYLGSGEEVLTAVAFLTATITTFVPAFLAASRHLSALSEDGFVPRAVSNLSYVFTLGAILILAIGNQNFLIDITDFLVLISLGIISVSGIWLRKRTIRTLKANDILPLVVGISCLVAGASVYFISASVAIFGSVSLAVVYLIYDIYELGWFGTQLFLGIFDGIVFLALILFPRAGFSFQYFVLFQWLGVSGSLTGSDFLSVVLMICTFAIFVNLSVDLSLKNSTRDKVERKLVPRLQ